jgi:hypothetical protein
MKYLHFQSTTKFLYTDSTGRYHMQLYNETSHTRHMCRYEATRVSLGTTE